MATSSIASLKTELNGFNGVAPIGAYNFPTASGIDSLYYFVESNSAYKEFFHFSVFCTIEQAIEQYGKFIPPDTIKIKISDIEFTYLGKEKGFHFFADVAGTFRIGFKDPETNTGLHNIRVQLNGLGIYAMGLVKLTSYINDVILKEIGTSNYYITRADLNIFCQFDLGSVIVPEHIVTRKRRFMKVIGEKYGYETLYIGKPPSKLRVYNKALEMDYSSMKAVYLERYLEQYGISTREPFWNFEIECHRDFLKRYKISTLDDLLTNAENLMAMIMKQVRFIDIATISEKDAEAERLYKAQNHPLWDYLASSYRFNAVEQKTIPLERIVYAPKELTAYDFVEEFRVLAAKYAEHAVTVDYEEIREVLHESHLWLTKKAQKAIEPFIPIVLETTGRNYLLTRNMVAVPTLPINLERLNDTEIKEIEELLTKALHQELSKEDQDIALIVSHTKQINQEKGRRRAGEGSEHGHD